MDDKPFPDEDVPMMPPVAEPSASYGVRRGRPRVASSARVTELDTKASRLTPSPLGDPSISVAPSAMANALEIPAPRNYTTPESADQPSESSSDSSGSSDENE